MTLTTQNPKEIKTGNSTATEFSFSFVINQSSDLVVTHTVTATGVETVLTEGSGTSNYSVSVGTYPGNGSITYPATLGTELPSTETLTLQRVVDLDQDTDLINQGAWTPKSVEDALDYSRMIDLQQQEELDRSIKFNVAEATITEFELPLSSTGSGGDVIALNSGKTGLEFATPNTNTYLTAPASSTDNAVVRFNGTGGRTFQNSSVTVDDNDLLVAPGGLGGNKGADIASAATPTVGTDGDHFDITGTTTITGWVVAAGRKFVTQFDAALTLTHSATLVLPGAANITTAAGDIFIWEAVATDDCRCIGYALASGAAVAGASAASTTAAGVVELATTAETATGTDAARAVTPDGLHDMTTLAGAAWFLDEDNMASDSATKVASQQSIKAYVDAINAGFILGTEQATTSGSTITFSSIPAGTKIIIIQFVGVSGSTQANMKLELGDSGGLETTGYTGGNMDLITASTQNTNESTSYFYLTANPGAAAAWHGHLMLTLEDSSDFTWTLGGFLFDTGGTTSFQLTAGSKALSAELTQLAVSQLSGAFDGGAMNITYIG